MKLGNLVTFERHYVRAFDNFDSEYIELLEEDERQKFYDNGYMMKKLIPKQEEKPLEGIVVGVRNLATGTRFDYIEDNNPYGTGEDWRWHSTPQPREKFYLVACNLNAIRKVKPEDLKLKMVEDPIEGLMDE